MLYLVFWGVMGPRKKRKGNECFREFLRAYSLARPFSLSSRHFVEAKLRQRYILRERERKEI